VALLTSIPLSATSIPLSALLLLPPAHFGSSTLKISIHAASVRDNETNLSIKLRQIGQDPITVQVR